MSADVELLDVCHTRAHAEVVTDPFDIAELNSLKLKPAIHAKIRGLAEPKPCGPRPYTQRVSSRRRAFMRMRVLYGGRCAYCGMRSELTKDHVIPKCLGGADEMSNILPACRPCNAEKGGDPLAVWRYRVVLAVKTYGINGVPPRYIGILERSRACFAPYPMTPRQRIRYLRERALEMERLEADTSVDQG